MSKKNKIEFNNLQDYQEINNRQIEYEDITLATCENGTRPEINLGLKRKKDDSGYVFSYFCGATWLKQEENGTIKYVVDNGKKVLLILKSRFSSIPSINYMLELISRDEEFEAYMNFETEDPNERIVTFFMDEDLIDIADEDSNIEFVKYFTFLSMLKKMLKKPLMKAAVIKNENLTGHIKGKIDINNNIASNTVKGRADRFYCKYTQQTVDIPANQLLKYALQLCKKNYIDKNGTLSNSELHTLYNFCKNKLSNVSNVKMKATDISRIKIPNMYSYYKKVLFLAKLVMESTNISTNIEQGAKKKMVPYAVNMSRLFECYVRSLIKIYIDGAKQESNQQLNSCIWYPEKLLPFQTGIKDVLKESNYEYQDKDYRRYHISGEVIPDLILQYPDDCPEKYRVFDVKYKWVYHKNKNQFYNNSMREDRLQLLAYGLLYNCKTIGHIFPGQGIPIESSICDPFIDDRSYYMAQIKKSLKGEDKDPIIKIFEISKSEDMYFKKYYYSGDRENKTGYEVIVKRTKNSVTKYGIVDWEDKAVEFYTEDEIKKFIKDGHQIMGVKNEGDEIVIEIDNNI